MSQLCGNMIGLSSSSVRLANPAPHHLPHPYFRHCSVVGGTPKSQTLSFLTPPPPLSITCATSILYTILVSFLIFPFCHLHATLTRDI